MIGVVISPGLVGRWWEPGDGPGFAKSGWHTIWSPRLVPASSRKSHFIIYLKALCQEHRVNFSFILVKLQGAVHVWGIKVLTGKSKEATLPHQIPNHLDTDKMQQ